MLKSRAPTGASFRIIVENAANISDQDVTERDIKKIGRSASIADRGIFDLFANSIRKDVITSFHKHFAKAGLNKSMSQYGKDQTLLSKESIKEAGQHLSKEARFTNPEFVEAAYSIGRWSIARYRRVVSELRDAANAYSPPNSTLVYELESLQWAIRSLDLEFEADNASVKSGDSDQQENERNDKAEADREVWQRYCVGVLGINRQRHQSISSAFQPPPNDIHLDMSKRKEAIAYFRQRIQKSFKELDYETFVKALNILPSFRVGPLILELVVPIMHETIPQDILKKEVYPSLGVLAVLQLPGLAPGRDGCSTSVQFIEKLYALGGNMITEDAVASYLEYCSHTQKSECARVIIDQAGDKITSEALVTAMIPVCMSGADHYIALMELFVMDKAVQAEIEDEENQEGYKKVGPVTSFMRFVALSSYLLIFLTAIAGYAKPASLEEMLEFQQDPCSKYNEGQVAQEAHASFVAHLFRNVCALNYSSIAWLLVQRDWIPPDINVELDSAIILGNQGIVHLLLESLLLPDPMLEPASLPLFFRNSDSLSLLPKVAQRFPREAAWFLEQMSAVPLPGCVPKNRHAEPDVRAKPIQGILLGSLTLAETIHRKLSGGPSIHAWRRMNMNGQLQKAGSGKGDYENECVICIAPEALLTANAEHNPLFGKTWSPTTSPFIRLLAEDNDQITLQPIMMALMEYHWAKGNFWMRFALQFFMTILYVFSLATTFVTVVSLQTGRLDRYPVFLYPISVLVLILAIFFIIQEIREFHDYPKKYIRSSSNLLDNAIHLCAMYAVIGGVFLGVQLKPFALSLTLVFCAFRVMIHLRILPSVGPLVRLAVTASVNITPILIPMAIMAVSFAAAFFLLEMDASYSDTTNAPHFESIGQSLQSILTMATTDYSVLDYSGVPTIFALRFIFHICFIIFLVNIIIALMTVNVADIHANMTSAWLLEIAALMVDLELFWPWPHRYSITESVTSSMKQIVPTTAPPNDPQNIDETLSNTYTVMYTWPKELVVTTSWWSIMTTKAAEIDAAEDKTTTGLSNHVTEAIAGPSKKEKENAVTEPEKAKLSNAWSNVLNPIMLIKKASTAITATTQPVKIPVPNIEDFQDLEPLVATPEDSPEAAVLQIHRASVAQPPPIKTAVIPKQQISLALQDKATPRGLPNRAVTSQLNGSMGSLVDKSALISPGTGQQVNNVLRKSSEQLAAKPPVGSNSGRALPMMTAAIAAAKPPPKRASESTRGSFVDAAGTPQVNEGNNVGGSGGGGGRRRSWAEFAITTMKLQRPEASQEEGKASPQVAAAPSVAKVLSNAATTSALLRRASMRLSGVIIPVLEESDGTEDFMGRQESGMDDSGKLANKLELIVDMLKSMEHVHRLESKSLKDKIVQLEEALETKLNNKYAQ